MPGHISEWTAQDVIDLVSDVLDENEKSIIIRNNINGLVLMEFASMSFLVKVVGLSHRSSFHVLVRLKDHLGITVIFPNDMTDEEARIRIVVPIRPFQENLGIHGAGDAAETAWRRRRYRIHFMSRRILGR
ncbi:hypothetical protein OSTOST_02288 [Ostertagia ostertagi]